MKTRQLVTVTALIYSMFTLQNLQLLTDLRRMNKRAMQVFFPEFTETFQLCIHLLELQLSLWDKEYFSSSGSSLLFVEYRLPYCSICVRQLLGVCFHRRISSLIPILRRFLRAHCCAIVIIFFFHVLTIALIIFFGMKRSN